MAKANGADDIVDIVVPRAAIPAFMDQVSALATEYDAWIAGCGHAGDGNVHLGVFRADDPRRSHGCCTSCSPPAWPSAAPSPASTASARPRSATSSSSRTRPRSTLMRRIKAAFDPNGILNPGTLFD